MYQLTIMYASYLWCWMGIDTHWACAHWQWDIADSSFSYIWGARAFVQCELTTSFHHMGVGVQHSMHTLHRWVCTDTLFLLSTNHEFSIWASKPYRNILMNSVFWVVFSTEGGGLFCTKHTVCTLYRGGVCAVVLLLTNHEFSIWSSQPNHNILMNSAFFNIMRICDTHTMPTLGLYQVYDTHCMCESVSCVFYSQHTLYAIHRAILFLWCTSWEHMDTMRASGRYETLEHWWQTAGSLQ